MASPDIVERHVGRARDALRLDPELRARLDARLLTAGGRSGAVAALRPGNCWRALRASGKLGAAIGLGLIGLGFSGGLLVRPEPLPEPPALPQPAAGGTPLLGLAAPLAPERVEHGAPPERGPTADSTASESAPPRRHVARHGATTSLRAPVKPVVTDADGEFLLLQRAERALRAGNAALALVLAHEAAERYPHSVLAEERAAIVHLAQCQDGTPAAAAQAARFLAAHPASLYAERIEALCSAPAAAISNETGSDKTSVFGH